jgi:N-acetylglucosaminyldiphosphoundecaprenol N-acetyl-beta-D-mannosaminyltransferase
VFLLGGAPGVAKRAARVLEAHAPSLVIAGIHCPPFGFEHDPAEMAAIHEALVESQPDIVLVAMSFPKTDLLIQRLRHVLPAASFLGVGISLSFITGEVRRAPEPLQAAGLEWLHRVIQEPRRLWRRYLLLGLPFAGRLVAAAGVARIQPHLGGPWYRHGATEADRTPRIGTPSS